MKIFSSMISVAKAPLIKLFLMPLLFVVALFLSACDSKSSISELSGQTMGTFWHVVIAEPVADDELEDVSAKISTTLQAVNQSMSTYIADSEISLFNQASAAEPYPLSAELLTVIDAALEVSAQTNGRYDITIAPLVNLWGFGPDKITKAPSESMIAETLIKVGYQKLQRVGDGIIKSDPQMKIDLSSIAKGYGVDRVATTLSQLGFEHYLVEIGGEIRTSGDKYGKPWQVAIEKPVDGREIQTIISLQDEHIAIASSGNYRNFIDYEGQRAVHTIDPLTGRPVTNTLLSTTVIMDNCMMADAYATALMILDEDAFAFANRHDLAAVMIYSDNNHDFNVVYSETFKQRFGEK